MKNKILKRLLIYVLVPLLLLGVVVWILGWLALRQITPGNLVKWMEASRNCRADIATCAVSLWSSPARVDITGITLVPRDAEAANAVPLENRPRLVRKTTYCCVGTATMEIDLADLIIHQRLSVRRLLLDQVDVKFETRPGAANSLQELFRPPAALAAVPIAAVPGSQTSADPAKSIVAVGTPAALATPPAPADRASVNQSPVRQHAAASGAAAPADPAGNDEPQPTPPFNARELKLPASLQQVSVTNGRLRIRNKRTKSNYVIADVNLDFTDLAVDPSHLDTANRATIAVRGKLTYTAGTESEPYTELTLDLRGRLTPFDASTGALAPVMTADAMLSQGSMIQNLPALQKLQKNIDLAQQAGLKLKPLAGRAELQHDTTLRLALADNRVRFVEDSALEFTDYELAVQKDGFIDLADDSHEFRATIRASDALSIQALKGADDFLAGLGGKSAGELKKLFITPLVKDGRVSMNFTTTGRLDKPKVKIDNPLTGFKDEFKEKGAELLDSIRDTLTPKAKGGRKEPGRAKKE